MKFKWDGKSRPSDDKYRKRWDEIFKKTMINLINYSKSNGTLKQSYQQSKLNKKERDDKEE
jgi:hypothetical protein